MHKVEPKVPAYIAEMKKPKPDYPRVSLSLDTLPEVKDWPMNGKYRVVIEGELTGLYNNDGKGDFTMEIHAIGGEAMEDKNSKRVSRKAERGGAKGD